MTTIAPARIRVAAATALLLAAARVEAASAPARPAASEAARPAATPPAPAPTIDPALEPAIRAFDAGEYEHAVELLQSLPPALVSSAEAQFYRGYSLLRLERWPDALVAIEAALALRPDDLRAVYLRALLRSRQGLPGVEEDFTRVRDALPDAPIGRSSADYLVELARAREQVATSQRTETSPTPEASPEPAPAQPAGTASGNLGEPASPWTLRPSGRITADFDTNPGLAPDLAGSTRGPRAGPASSPHAVPALTLSVRTDVTRQVGTELSLSAGVSALQRLYPPRTGAGDPLNSPGTSTMHGGGTGAVHGVDATGGGLESSAGQTGTSNDLSEAAFELGAYWRSGGIAWRGGYRGSLVLYGFSAFAHEHTVWTRATWPSSSWLSATLRLSAVTLQPLDASYDQLRGFGGSARPVASLLLLGGALLVEGGWGVETYRADDYRAASAVPLDELREHEVVYSYSYDGHGPELYVSWLGPWQLHLVAWGSTSFRTYRDADVWDQPVPGSGGGMMGTGSAWVVETLRRRDLHSLVGARASKGFLERGELFVEASYLDNRSNLDTAGNERNLRRFLLSVGAQWR